MESASYSRRSGRIARRISVALGWQPPGSAVHDDPAETILLSKHGCTCYVSSPRQNWTRGVRLCPEREKSLKARVVYREIKGGSEDVSSWLLSFWAAITFGKLSSHQPSLWTKK